MAIIRTWRITVILIAGKNLNTQIVAPCLDKHGAGSGISSLYLWGYIQNTVDKVCTLMTDNFLMKGNKNRQQNFDLKEMALHKSIPLKSWGLSVYVCMSNYKFCHALRYGAETWHRGRSGPRGWCATFWSDPIKCHRSSRGQTTSGMLYGYHFKRE